MTPSQPSLHARSHGLRIGELRHALQGRLQRERLQERAPLVERQRHDVAAVEPHDVEDVVEHAGLVPRDLPVENRLAHRQLRDRGGNRRTALGKTVTGEQTDVERVLVGEHTNAIELALEDPLRAAEALLRQRRGHRDDPFGKGCRHGAQSDNTNRTRQGWGYTSPRPPAWAQPAIACSSRTSPLYRCGRRIESDYTTAVATTPSRRDLTGRPLRAVLLPLCRRGRCAGFDGRNRDHARELLCTYAVLDRPRGRAARSRARRADRA